MPYGRGTYGSGRYGGGYGAGSPPEVFVLGPYTMRGTALMYAAGTRGVHTPLIPMLGKGLMTARAVISISLSGDIRMNMAPSGYIRVAVPPVSPASVGIENAYIERVSVIMGQPTIDANTGRPN